MLEQQQQWILKPTERLPEWFQTAVKQYLSASDGKFAAQLLWQRGIRELAQLEAFVKIPNYKPASPFAFAQEMELAMERLKKAWEVKEKICIWGDFDADGITSTAVLWDGLGEFFCKHTQLIYYIPNRFTESHGLNIAGIDRVFEQGCQLIITCDTGSTNISEITYANQLGIDVIVTDHHTLPPERPPVKAIINPRYLPEEHPLYHLSGVAVAYKLVEALYQTLPQEPQHPLSDLLDLVAVGLIADLVQLSGDCRYLAQVGINKLQQDFKLTPETRRRPGVGRLLELCQRNGDRPTDISFGLGPRINAVSRIQGDASFCVELLTSRDRDRVQELAEFTELANTRRKSLQKDVANQVTQKLNQLDLSTTSVIVLSDPQWAVGVLGLVAGQVAQETGRPTILLSTEAPTSSEENDDSQVFARGSARSINGVDLYKLVKDQAHLLHRFGGHPFAAGLSLAVENIPLFTEAINQQLRQTLAGTVLTPTIEVDLTVNVADLGKELFFELKLIEPCGMGNPVPKLLIQNCWFENTWHRNQQDSRGKKVQYIKSEFNLKDESTNKPFPGVWWGHYKDEIPPGRCDCLVELDYNTYKRRYEVRLLAVRPALDSAFNIQQRTSIIDWRNPEIAELQKQEDEILTKTLVVEKCPRSWDDLRAWLRRSLHAGQPLAIAWSKPQFQSPSQIWLTLVGIAKYLSRTRETVTRIQLLEKLDIGDYSLQLGLKALRLLGFSLQRQDRNLQFEQKLSTKSQDLETAINQFLAAIKEEQFQQQYFAAVPLSAIQVVASEIKGIGD
ncbi:single-stranded-DNA-specific exonuclease RecJ [Mastigocoleus testarum]|uniref:Single-stranded-DNA-specific exonuclease RecJ n=1 Tax=Mastigocoleus testarum BC008 TaxID=371196 RepID=A0A0V7ZBY2_9CYAN|nr:single-stranded-DNA-specific exonuclease RecJ [Mastigocoleus testarum]KST62020.1 single-stranded-DNA-specific exonuclease RecJ [Mastigocoleus testarum BC008]